MAIIERDHFLNANCSQGSVTARSMCGKIFNNYLVTNLLTGVSGKQFLLVSKIWQSYRREFECLPFWSTMYNV